MEQTVGFYVTAKSSKRAGFLVGPLPTHDEALALVDRARAEAAMVDDQAHFYAFGTAKVTGAAATLVRGRLNARFGLPPRES